MLYIYRYDASVRESDTCVLASEFRVFLFFCLVAGHTDVKFNSVARFFGPPTVGETVLQSASLSLSLSAYVCVCLSLSLGTSRRRRFRSYPREKKTHAQDLRTTRTGWLVKFDGFLSDDIALWKPCFSDFPAAPTFVSWRYRLGKTWPFKLVLEYVKLEKKRALGTRARTGRFRRNTISLRQGGALRVRRSVCGTPCIPRAVYIIPRTRVSAKTPLKTHTNPLL